MSAPSSTVERIFGAVQRVEEVLLSTGILVVAALTIVNVVSRTAFGVSLAFAEEVSQFLIILVTFIGASYAASKGRHIRMTAIYDQLSDRWRRWFMVFITAATSGLMALLTWYAIRYVGTVHALGTVSPALRVPLYLVYASAPVGLTLACIQYGLACY